MPLDRAERKNVHFQHRNKYIITSRTNTTAQFPSGNKINKKNVPLRLYSRINSILRNYGYILALLFGSCLTTAIPALAVEIIAFGDSITAGTGSDSGGYPARLQQIIQSTGKPCSIYNCGVPGERTYQGVDRIDTVLDYIPADIILIMEGTNDIRSGYPWQTTQLNLQLMIDKAKARGVTPILATLTPSNQVNSEVLIPNRWNPMIKELARQNEILLVDQYSALEALWSSLNDDGIHPNDDGYLYLAKTWNNTIGDMISATGKFIRPGFVDLRLVILVMSASLLLYLTFRRKIKTRSPSLIIPKRIRKNTG